MPISLGPQIHGNQEQCLSSHGSAKSSSRLPKPTARSTSNANKSRPSTHGPRAMSLVTRQRKVIKSLAQPRPTTPEEQEQYQSVSALIPTDQEQWPLVPRQRNVIKSLAQHRGARAMPISLGPHHRETRAKPLIPRQRKAIKSLAHHTGLRCIAFRSFEVVERLCTVDRSTTGGKTLRRSARRNDWRLTMNRPPDARKRWNLLPHRTRQPCCAPKTKPSASIRPTLLRTKDKTVCQHTTNLAAHQRPNRLPAYDHSTQRHARRLRQWLLETVVTTAIVGGCDGWTSFVSGRGELVARLT